MRKKLFVQAEHWFERAGEKGINVEKHFQISKMCLQAALGSKELFELPYGKIFSQVAQSLKKAEAKGIIEGEDINGDQYFHIIQTYLSIAVKNNLSLKNFEKLFFHIDQLVKRIEERGINVEQYIQIAQAYLLATPKKKLSEVRGQLCIQASQWFGKAEEKSLNPKQYIQIAQAYFEAAAQKRLSDPEHSELFFQASQWLGKAERKGLSPEQYLQIAQAYLEYALQKRLSDSKRSELFFQASQWYEKADKLDIDQKISIAQQYLEVTEYIKLNGWEYIKLCEQAVKWLTRVLRQENISISQIYKIAKVYLQYAQSHKLNVQVHQQLLVEVENNCNYLILQQGNFDQIYGILKYYLKINHDVTFDKKTRQDISQQVFQFFEALIKQSNKLSIMSAFDAYDMGQKYLKISYIGGDSIGKEIRNKSLSKAMEYLKQADKLADIYPGKAYSKGMQYPWLTFSQESIGERITALNEWLEKAHGNYGYLYWLGKYYLEVEDNPARALSWFKIVCEKEGNIGKVAAAYQLGRIYALAAPYDFRSKMTAQQHFKTQVISTEIEKEWQSAAQQDNQYAYVLKQLYKAQGRDGLSEEIKRNASAYKRDCQEKLMSNQISLKVILEPLGLSHEPCECIIMGSGYTGILSAIHLANLRNIDNQPLFKVILLEKGPHLMGGASMIAGRLHLGGEYPLNRTTAQDCLHGALLFRQMIPQGYTDIPAVTYVVDSQSQVQAERSNGAQGLSTKKMVAEYQYLTNRYAKYYSFLKK